MTLSELQTTLEQAGLRPVRDDHHYGPRLLVDDRFGLAFASPEGGLLEQGEEIEVYDEETGEHDTTRDPAEIPALIAALTVALGSVTTAPLPTSVLLTPAELELLQEALDSHLDRLHDQEAETQHGQGAALRAVQALKAKLELSQPE